MNNIESLPTSNKNEKEKDVSPLSSGKRLQRKLIQLSLELDDKVKRIALLKEAMMQNEETGNLKQKEEEAMFLAKFHDHSRMNKAKQEALLEKCNHAIDKKKELAAQTEDLIKAKKVTEDETRDEVEKIRKQFKSTYDEEFSTWEEGKSIRQGKWLEQKTKEFRDITVQGLAPEVQRILTKHQINCAEIEAEGELRKKKLMLESEHKYDAMLGLVNRENENKSSELIGTMRTVWTNRLSKINDQHEHSLTRLREQLSEGIESQRSRHLEVLRKMAENHTKEITKIKSNEAKRLRELTCELSREKKYIAENIMSETETITNEDIAERESWEKQTTHEVQKRGNECLEVECNRLMTQRDENIDELIRSIQREEKEDEREAQRLIGAESARLESIHKETTKRAQQKYGHWVEKLSIYTQETQVAIRANENYEEDIKLIEERIESSERNIAESSQRREIIEQKALDESQQIDLDSIAKCDKLNLKKVFLEKEIAHARVILQEKDSEHEEVVGAIMSEHSDELDQIEMNVKDTMKEKERKQTSMSEIIQECEIRLEHTQQIIQQYRTNEIN